MRQTLHDKSSSHSQTHLKLSQCRQVENAASELSNGPSAQAGALHQELLDLLAAAASLLAVPVTRMAVPARSLLQQVSSALQHFQGKRDGGLFGHAHAQVCC